MKKADLVVKIAEQAGFSRKDADKALTAVLDAITDTLVKDGKVSLVGFGTFEVKQRAARMGRNPATKAPMEIKAAKVPAFKAGKGLKDKVNA